MKIGVIAAFAALVAVSAADAKPKSCSAVNGVCYRTCNDGTHVGDNCTGYCDRAMSQCMSDGTYFIDGHVNMSGLKRS